MIESYQTLGLNKQLDYPDGSLPVELAWQELELYARPGTEFEVLGLRALNGTFEVVIHEVRLGDDDYRLEGPIDVAIFNTQAQLFVPMKLGIVTSNIPLVLCVMPFGTPSVLPYINLAAFGKEKILDADKAEEHARAKTVNRVKGQARDIHSSAVELQSRSGFQTKVVQYIEIEVPGNLGNITTVPDGMDGFEVRRTKR